jgi:hypothetical protein
VFEENAIARAVINPLGIFPTPEYSMLYRFNQRNFGMRESLRCPYYIAQDGGLCAIWKHRNGRCSTWFCKHERGSVSVVFWKYLDKLLSSVETALAKWCLLEVDPGSRALAELIPASGDPVAGSKTVWGKWAGNEREFFMACARAVECLSWSRIAEIVGPETHVLARLTRDAFEKLQSSAIPERLKQNAWTAEACGPSRRRVWTYSPFDPLELDNSLLDALSLFDGTRPTAEVIDAIQAGREIHIDTPLLQKLCDVRILIEADEI